MSCSHKISILQYVIGVRSVYCNAFPADGSEEQGTSNSDKSFTWANAVLGINSSNKGAAANGNNRQYLSNAFHVSGIMLNT